MHRSNDTEKYVKVALKVQEIS